MSQIQTFLGSVIPPAGPVDTLTGDDAIPVVPVAGNINVVGIRTGHAFPATVGFAQTSVGVGGNDLWVGPLSATVTSNDATYTTLYSLPIAADKAAFLLVRVIGMKDDFSVCAGGNLFGIARNPGGGGVTVPKTGGSLLTDKDPGPFPLGRVINVGNNLEVQVSGAALGDVYNWTCHVEYQKQS